MQRLPLSAATSVEHRGPPCLQTVARSFTPPPPPPPPPSDQFLLRVCSCALCILTVCEYTHLEYIRVPGIYRETQAEYGIRILVAVSQEDVHSHSTCRVSTC